MLFTTTPKQPLMPRKTITQLQNLFFVTKEGEEKTELEAKINTAIQNRIVTVKAQYTVTTNPLQIECVDCCRRYQIVNKITDNNRKQWGHTHQKKCAKFYDKDLSLDTEEYINNLLETNNL